MEKQEALQKLESRLLVIFRDSGGSGSGLKACMDCCMYPEKGPVRKPSRGEVLAVCLALREIGVEPANVVQKVRELRRADRHPYSHFRLDETGDVGYGFGDCIPVLDFLDAVTQLLV